MIVTIIEDYRERQYQDYQQTLVDVECIELIKCNGCGYDAEDVEYCVVHDVSQLKQAYCKECIEIYKQENI